MIKVCSGNSPPWNSKSSYCLKTSRANIWYENGDIRRPFLSQISYSTSEIYTYLRGMLKIEKVFSHIEIGAIPENECLETIAFSSYFC